jgi:hypothetical protein
MLNNNSTKERICLYIYVYYTYIHIYTPIQYYDILCSNITLNESCTIPVKLEGALVNISIYITVWST